MNKVQLQLQQLNQARARLSSSIQERSRVTDLICQSMSPSNSYVPEPSRPSSARQPWSTRSSASSIRSSRSQSVLSQLPSGYQSSYTTVGKSSSTPQPSTRRHSKSYSAPAPLIGEGMGIGGGDNDVAGQLSQVMNFIRVICVVSVYT